MPEEILNINATKQIIKIINLLHVICWPVTLCRTYMLVFRDADIKKHIKNMLINTCKNRKLEMPDQ